MKFILLLISIIFTPFIVYSQQQKQNPQLHKIDILHYDFDLKLSDSNDVITVKEKVDLKILENSNSFYLQLKSFKDGKGMNVESVSVNGSDVKYVFEKDLINVFYDCNNGDTIVCKLNYSGIPDDGLIISENKYGKRSFFGDNWPDRCHHWLAVIDHPSDKATVDFMITIPSHYEVVASGKLIEKKDNVLTKSWHFRTEVPLPTKVMVLGAADFNVKLYGYVDSIPVSSMVFTNSPPKAIDDYLPAMKVIQFYIDSIGKYPYEKLVNVQSKTIYGGMENAGNIFYFENSANGKNKVEDLVAHEIAHQWFGNSLSEYDWHDIWLSEGFATYLADLYIRHVYGDEVFKMRLYGELQKVIEYNKENKSPIIDSSITDLIQLLSPVTYEKAAWILHMLHIKVGDKKFFNILQNFYSHHKSGNVLTSDFIEEVNKSTGSDYSGFFKQWLYSEGIPELDLSWNCQNKIITFDIKQYSGSFNFDLPVRLSDGYMSQYFILKINDQLEHYAYLVDTSMNEAKMMLTVDPDRTILQNTTTKNIPPESNIIHQINDQRLLKPGDLLFQDLDCGELCDAIESVTDGYNGWKFSHVAMVVENSNDLMIEEAIGKDVHITSFRDFLDRYKDDEGNPKVVVGRLKDDKSLDRIIKNSSKYIGMPYDDIFKIGDEKYYCSDLIYNVYKDKKYFFDLNPMTFKSQSTNDFLPVWTDYYNKMKVPIPEGKPGLNPGSISRSNRINIIYKFGEPDRK